MFSENVFKNHCNLGTFLLPQYDKCSWLWLFSLQPEDAFSCLSVIKISWLWLFHFNFKMFLYVAIKMSIIYSYDNAW